MGLLGAILGCLGAILGALGASWGQLGAILEVHKRRFFRKSGFSRGPRKTNEKQRFLLSGVTLGSIVRPLGCLLEGLGVLLGASWEALGVLLGAMMDPWCSIGLRWGQPPTDRDHIKTHNSHDIGAHVGHKICQKYWGLRWFKKVLVVILGSSL